MSDYGQKFHHAGSPDPGPLQVAQTSDVTAHGWAGTGGAYHSADNIEEAGAEYGRATSAAVGAAMSKRDAELSALNK
jgi:hypothetical protein